MWPAGAGRPPGPLSSPAFPRGLRPSGAPLQLEASPGPGCSAPSTSRPYHPCGVCWGCVVSIGVDARPLGSCVSPLAGPVACSWPAGLLLSAAHAHRTGETRQGTGEGAAWFPVLKFLQALSSGVISTSSTWGSHRGDSKQGKGICLFSSRWS